MRNTYLTPISSAKMTASQFLKVSEKDAENIKSSRFVPPSFGKKGFGKFEVEYKTPILVNHE